MSSFFVEDENQEVKCAPEHAPTTVSTRSDLGAHTPKPQTFESIICAKLWKEGMSKKNLERELKRIESIYNIPIGSNIPTAVRLQKIRRCVEEKEIQISEAKATEDAAQASKSLSIHNKAKENSGNVANIAQPLISRPEWLPDGSANTCLSCTTEFSLFTRRHHCRACGDIFCYKCTQSRVAIPCLEFLEPVRVCDDCLPRITLSSMKGGFNVFQQKVGTSDDTLLDQSVLEHQHAAWAKKATMPKSAAQAAKPVAVAAPPKLTSGQTVGKKSAFAVPASRRPQMRRPQNIPPPPPLPKTPLFLANVKKPAAAPGKKGLPFLQDIKRSQKLHKTPGREKKLGEKVATPGRRPFCQENLADALKKLKKTPKKGSSSGRKRKTAPMGKGISAADLQVKLKQLRKTPTKGSMSRLNQLASEKTLGNSRSSLNSDLIASIKKMRKSVTGETVEAWESSFNSKKEQKRKVMTARHVNQFTRSSNSSPGIKTIRGLKSYLDHRDLNGKENVDSPRSDFSDSFADSPITF
jgi:hypothetical protein